MAKERMFIHVVGNPAREAKLAETRAKAAGRCVFAAAAIAQAAARRERRRTRPQGAYGAD